MIVNNRECIWAESTRDLSVWRPQLKRVRTFKSGVLRAVGVPQVGGCANVEIVIEQGKGVFSVYTQARTLCDHVKTI